MLCLTIEESTRQGSLALLDGDAVIDHVAWRDERFHSQELFVRLPALLARHRVTPAEVDLYAVGLGPGSFTGLRMALTAANAMALPHGRSVYGLSSAAAIAAEAGASTGCARVLAAGDAHRGMLWAGLFERQAAGEWALQGEWRLASAPELTAPRGIAGDTAIATPDWDRIGTVLEEAAANNPGCTLIRSAVTPRADALGRAAVAQLARGVPSLPLSPIYLHPAVAVRPA